MKLFNKSFEKKDIITAILWIILSLFMVFYILKGSKSFINYDASFLVDYCLEQIRTNSLFPINWFETNDFWLYSLIPLINIFIRLGINLFTSRQLAVLIQSIIIFIVLYKVFYDGKNKNSYWIPGLLLISGISGQITYEIFGDGAYGTLLLWMLLVLLNVTRYLEKNKTKNLLFIGISLTLLTMFSIRFPVYITAPLIVVLIYLYLENGIKREYINLGITLAVSFVFGFLLHQLLANNLLYVTNYGRELVGDSQKFADSLNELLYQIFYLSGATNTNLNFGYWDLTGQNLQIKADSFLNIFVFVRYIYAISLFIIPFVLRKKIKEFSFKDKIIYIYTIALMGILSFFLIICGMSDWYKYMVPIIFMLTTLFIFYYRYSINNIRVKSIFIILTGLFVIYSLFLNTVTFYSFEKNEFRDNYYQGLTDFLIKNDLTFGYEYPNLGKNVYTLLSNGKVRVDWLDNNGIDIAPRLWLNSKDWFKREEHRGKIFFMRLEEDNQLKCEQMADAIIDYRLDEEHLVKIFVFENSNVLYNEIDLRKIYN